MFNKLLCRFRHNKASSRCLALVLLTIAVMVTAVDSTLRALSDDQFLDGRNANSITNFSFSKTLPPFGPDILKGYQSCDEFKADLVNYLTSSGENFIQEQTNCSCYYVDKILFSNCSSDIPYSQQTHRTQKRESSYGTNNQVPNVNERELIQSDGKYIYAASGDRILVFDLNGKVVANVTIPSPSLTSINHTSSATLDSIFIKNNMLTAFAFREICDVDLLCNSTYSLFYFDFKEKTKTMTLVKHYEFSTLFTSVDYRQIEDYTHILATAHFDDIYVPLYHCNNFKYLSAYDYEAAALAYLNSNVNQYASEIVAKLLKEGATSTCNNIIKLFNETGNKVSFVVTTKVFSIGLSSISQKAFFFPFMSFNSHISKNSMLVTFQGSFPDTFLVKFSMNDLVITPTSVGTIDGSISSQYDIDLYNGYYRIASTSYSTLESQITVLQEQNSQLLDVGHVTVGAGAVQSARLYNEEGFLATNQWTGVSYNGSSTTLNFLNLTSPTNPSIVASEFFNSQISNLYPIEDGKYIIFIDSIVSKANASGITVYLFQATNQSLKPVRKPSEVIITEQDDGYFTVVSSDAMWDSHAFRYLSQSHKLIIPVTADGYGSTDVIFGGEFHGFYVYDVDLTEGVKYLGNVTHDSNSYSYHPRSLVFDGDLITFMGNTIKRTSTVTTLSNLRWELENY